MNARQADRILKSLLKLLVNRHYGEIEEDPSGQIPLWWVIEHQSSLEEAWMRTNDPSLMESVVRLVADPSGRFREAFRRARAILPHRLLTDRLPVATIEAIHHAAELADAAEHEIAISDAAYRAWAANHTSQAAYDTWRERERIAVFAAKAADAAADGLIGYFPAKELDRARADILREHAHITIADLLS